MSVTQDTKIRNEEPKIPHFSIDYMNLSANPRNDFYEYSVGKWIRTNPIPQDKSRWDAISELHERNLVLLKQILEESALDSSSEPGSPKRLVGEFFRSAMDTKRIEEIGFKPIQSLLDRVKVTLKA